MELHFVEYNTFFLINFINYFLCMSAFQSPMRVHGDNIYVLCTY